MKTVLLLATSLASLAAAPKIVGGPFVVNTTSRNATIVWLVESDGVTFQASAPEAQKRTSPSIRVEKTTLAGLQPNTRYDYSVTGEEGGQGWFKTAPVLPEPYTFAVYGDTRTRHDVHRNVINALVQHGIPDFVMHTGDLVADGGDHSLWPIFFDIEKTLLRQTTFFPALGNHDHNSRNFFDYFQGSPYYSFDWGTSHFIVLNTDIGNAAVGERAKRDYWNDQVNWLEEDLASHQKSDFLFVFGHHPPYTAVARRQGDNPHIAALVPMFEKYRVTAAFWGHDHNYQHYLKNGIHYVGTGGGGAPLYDVDKPAEGITQKVVSVENFVSVKVNGKAAHIESIAIDGRKLDEFDLHAAGTQK